MVCMSAATPTIEATNPFSNHRVNNRRPRVVLLLVLLRRPAGLSLGCNTAVVSLASNSPVAGLDLPVRFYRGRGFAPGAKVITHRRACVAVFGLRLRRVPVSFAPRRASAPVSTGRGRVAELLAEPSSPTRLIS